MTNNRLADTLSPYLRSHADNPVDWFPWGEDAFAEAQRRDVPLLISIGYSTCHWCHVMARESFSEPETAALINGGFVAVKVDREEHPDVDGAYMAAASAFTQNLGCPLTAFATPQGRTFYAGTYWPPSARGGQARIRDVLEAAREAWMLRREQAIESADAVAEALAEAADITPSLLPTATALAAAAVTTTEIATAAGISPRSFFRSKDDVMLSGLREAGEHVRDARAARPAEEAIWDSLRVSFRQLTETSSFPTDDILGITTLIMTSPSTQSRDLQKRQEWEDILLPEIMTRLPRRELADGITDEDHARAVLACVDAATRAWLRADGRCRSDPRLSDDAVLTSLIVNGLGSSASIIASNFCRSG